MLDLGAAASLLVLAGLSPCSLCGQPPSASPVDRGGWPQKPLGHTVPSSHSTQGLPPVRPHCGGISCVVLSACARSHCPHSSSKHPEASLGMGAGAAGMLQAPCPASQPPQSSSVALVPLLCGGVWGPPVHGAVPCCSRKALGLVEGDCTRLAGGMWVFVG